MKGKIYKKLIISITLIMYLMCTVISPFRDVFGYEKSEYKSGIENFPKSYQNALKALKTKYPNWNFVAVYTNLGFDYTVSQEMVSGRSLISKSAFSDEWKRDNVEVEPGWVNASEKAVRYFLDPRNFLNEEKIFQFESSSLNAADNADVVENILSGTGLAKANYYINNKQKVDMGKRFSDVIYEAAKSNNVSAAHLASRIIQETGGTLGSIKSDGSVLQTSDGNVGYYTSSGAVRRANRAINGSYGEYTGYYNFFNIGAFCSKSCGWCGNPFVHGLQRAKSQNWNTPAAAISAAANYLNNNWIKYGQNTVYFEKFDVNFVDGSLYLFGNQYMTNISAASTESSLMYQGYKNSNRLNESITFYIPVYDNMPDNGSSDDTQEKKVQVVNCEGSSLNLREGSGTSYKVIASLANGTIMTQILDDGSGWVKVRLDNGTEGYVSKEYISEVKQNIEVTSILLSKQSYDITIGNRLTLTPVISPSNANNKDYSITSDNSNIVKVDGKAIVGVNVGSANVTFKTSNGKTATVKVNVTQKSESDKKYEIDSDRFNISEDNMITNINNSTNAGWIKEGFNILDSNVKIELKNVDGQNLNDDGIVGTGTRVNIMDSNNKIAEYVIIVRGDVNGDGKITASDYVNVKNKIMGTVSLDDIKTMGADVNKDGKVSASDYVLIKNHIMGYSTITN